MAKRIVILISQLGVGGAQRASLRLARGLGARGHLVEVWGLYRQADSPDEGVNTRIIKQGGRPGVLGQVGVAWRTWRALRAAKPDAVISFLPFASLVGQSAALLFGIKTRIVSHRVSTPSYRRPLRFLDRLAGSVGLYTHVISVSEAVRDTMSTYPRSYRKRIEVVHNGIDFAPSTLTADEARQKFKLPNDKKLLLAVGRLEYQKNYPTLIDAVAAAPELHLVIAGDGSKRQKMKARAIDLGIQDRVHFLGHVVSDQVPDIYRACDAFALSSHYEGQSNALLEAMTEGMAIFASDIPEQVETLVDEDGTAAGVLLPADDPSAWATALRDIMSDPARMEAYRQAAKARSAAFTLKAMIDGFEKPVLESSVR